MKYIIIGNSYAAVGAVEGIRQNDSQGKITVISDEKFHTYARPLISYYLAGKVEQKNMFYRDKDFYRVNKVEALLGRKVLSIDKKKKTVLLDNKKKLFFDKLLIASGGVPIVPPMEGVDSKGVFTFTKWEDIERIKDYIKKRKPSGAVVIGGGLIGIKAVDGLIANKIKITIVELAERILSTALDKKGSEIVAKGLKKKGVNVRTGDTVVSILGGKTVEGVRFKSGKTLDADMVIVAIGVRPNTEIAKQAGIKVNRGIVTDKFMKTSAKDIYAAGDCVESLDILNNITRPMPILPNAYKQGKIAGINMAAEKKSEKVQWHGSFTMNAIEVGSVPTISIGVLAPEESSEEYEVLKRYDSSTGNYRKVVLKDNRIVGAVFVGNVERAGIFTGLIEDKIDITNFKGELLKDEFGYVSLPKEIRKYKMVPLEVG